MLLQVAVQERPDVLEHGGVLEVLHNFLAWVLRGAVPHGLGSGAGYVEVVSKVSITLPCVPYPTCHPYPTYHPSLPPNIGVR